MLVLGFYKLEQLLLGWDSDPYAGIQHNAHILIFTMLINWLLFILYAGDSYEYDAPIAYI
jgi:hypothetical protein